MTPTKAKMAAVLCGLSMAGAGLFSGGLNILDTSPVAAATVLSQTNSTSGTVTTGQDQPSTAATAQPKITFEQALKIARGEAQGDVRQLELDWDDGMLLWEVKLGNAKVYIDAEDGTVLRVKTRDTTETFPAATITIEQAIEIAQGKVQGDFREAELDMNNGSLVWEIEIGNSEVYVDAKDGSVLSIKERNADHHDDDDHDDDHDDD